MANTSSDYFVNKCITKVQDKITEHETLKPRKGNPKLRREQNIDSKEKRTKSRFGTTIKITIKR